MKNTFLAVLAALLCVVYGTPALAEGDATRFIITVLKVELKDASGNWVKIAEPNKAANLLADDPLLQMTNNGSIPPGTYVNFRITLSETIRFSGNDGENKTLEGGVLTLGGTASKSSDMPRNEIKTFVQDIPTWNTAAEGLMTEYLNLDYEDRDDVMEITGRRLFTKPIVVKEKSMIKVAMGLDLKRSVHYAWPDYFSGITSKEAMYFLPPKEVAEVTVKVDAKTALVTGEAIEWAF